MVLLDRRKSQLYTDLMEDDDRFSEDIAYAEGAIGELFTEAEVGALVAYLDREHGSEGVTTIEEVSLPIPNNTFGVGALPIGGGRNYYRLDQEPQYDLAFEVRGFFDLLVCELSDGSGPYRHPPFVVPRSCLQWLR